MGKPNKLRAAGARVLTADSNEEQVNRISRGGIKRAQGSGILMGLFRERRYEEGRRNAGGRTMSAITVTVHLSYTVGTINYVGESSGEIAATWTARSTRS